MSRLRGLILATATIVLAMIVASAHAFAATETILCNGTSSPERCFDGSTNCPAARGFSVSHLLKINTDTKAVTDKYWYPTNQPSVTQFDDDKIVILEMDNADTGHQDISIDRMTGTFHDVETNPDGTQRIFEGTCTKAEQKF